MPITGSGSDKITVTFSPEEASERIVAIDVTRAVALLAVLQVNLFFYSGQIYSEWAKAAIAFGWGGKALDWLINAFLNGRGLGLFSMLFAVGLSIQMERAQARSVGYWPFAFRRLGALALIGIFHSLVIWNGDILVPYAFLGLIILPLLRARPRTIFLALFLSLILSLTYGYLLRWLRAPDELFFSHWSTQLVWLKQMADQAFGHGTWWEAARWRAWECGNLHLSINVMTLFDCLPFFISGLILWRSRLLQNAISRHPFLLRSFHALFWPSMLIIIATQLTDWISESWWNFWSGIPMRLAMKLGELACVVSYLFGIMVIFQRPWWGKHLRKLAPMGRMSLTNYLTQSLVFTWVFCGFGAGFWNRVSLSMIVWIGMAFFAVQILWSRWWLGLFRFGPAEWLWRSMSYGRWQRLRRPKS